MRHNVTKPSKKITKNTLNAFPLQSKKNPFSPLLATLNQCKEEETKHKDQNIRAKHVIDNDFVCRKFEAPTQILQLENIVNLDKSQHVK